MNVVLKERPTPRIIEFYGVSVTFVPAFGTYWITASDLVDALGATMDDLVDEMRPLVQSPNFLSVSDYSPKFGPLVGCRKHPCPHLSLANAIEIADTSVLYCNIDSERRSLLLELLKTLQSQKIYRPIHIHTFAPTSEHFRSLLEKNLHWEGVLLLRNLGKTEGEIAKALSVKVTEVRSALLSLEKYGFDLLKGERLEMQREYGGKAIHIPAVTPAQNSKNCLKFRQKE